MTHHSNFPESTWIVVEQPRFEAHRYVYESATGTFLKTEDLFLLTDRGFRGVYGWIGGSGVPPQPHFDIMVWRYFRRVYGA